MAPNPFRACDLCGTNNAQRPCLSGRQAWTLIDATRKMACATCTPAAQAEGRKARKVLKRYHSLLKNRLAEEPTPLPGLGLYNGYRRIKAQYPDAVLIYRTGDWYTALDSDARILHRELGLQLSSWQPHGLDRASFPFAEMEIYLPRLVKAGYRVAICDELQGVADGPRNVKD